MKLGRGLALFGWALPALAQYAGPAILSRGEAPAAMVAPEIKFRPFVEITSTYDSGLSGVAVTNAQGDLPNQSSFGVALNYGVSGTHSWRHTKLGLSYSGALQHLQKSSFDSLTQSFMLSISHQLSRHTSLSVRESAGMFTRAFGLGRLNQTVAFDPSQSYIPTTDFFDNRTYYFSTQADLTIQKTARLSFTLGGDHFATRYRAKGLVGTTGVGARGDVQYRLSRLSTIGGNYMYGHFGYKGTFGSTDVHSVAGSYARALTSKVEFSASIGASRVEPKFIQTVAVDPIIAILLGVSRTTQIAHFVVWTPSGTARISRTFRDGVLYLTAERGVLPGNGLFTTSYSDSVSAGYAYTGLRRWSLSALTSYNHSKSVGNFSGFYSGLSGGFTASRQIVRGVHFVVGLDARKYSSPGFENYNRTIVGAHAGVGFTPGDVPLRLW